MDYTIVYLETDSARLTLLFFLVMRLIWFKHDNCFQNKPHWIQAALSEEVDKSVVFLNTDQVNTLTPRYNKTP